MWAVGVLVLGTICVSGLDIGRTLRNGIEELYERSRPDTVYNTRLYPYHPTAPVLPEVAVTGRPVGNCSVGVAFSGGGTRSLTCTLGQLRGLHARGYFPQIQYFSAVSGGAWASSAFTYANAALSVAQLTGFHAEPETLVVGTEGEDPPDLHVGSTWVSWLDANSIGQVARRLSTSSLVWSGLSSLFTGVSPDRFWEQLIYNEVLKPYGVGVDKGDQPYSWSGGYVQTQVTPTNNGLPPNRFSLVGRTLPYPYLIVNTAIVPNATSPYFALPFECTPLYVGIPPTHDGVGADGADVGGGWQDPFSFNSCKVQKGVLAVRLLRGSNLRNRDTNGESDPYVEVTVEGLPPQRTRVHENNLNPTFDQTLDFTFMAISPNTQVKVAVMDEDDARPDESLGEGTFPFRGIAIGSGRNITIPLDEGGMLTLSVQWRSFELIGENGTMLRVISNSLEYSLKSSVGTSSVEPAVRINANSNSLDDVIIPRFTYFPPRNLQHTRNIPATYNFIDGGSLENTGVIPLLRRRLPRIIAFINTNEPLSQDTVTNQSSIASQVAVLFGFQPKPAGQPWRTFADPLYDPAHAIFSRNQVFPSSSLAALRDGLLAEITAGRPATMKQTLPVLRNIHHGVEAGTVDILWMYNQLNAEWRNRLTPAMRTVLDTRTANFPHYSTTSQLQLNPFEINFLSSMWSTTVMNSSAVRSMFCNEPVPPMTPTSPQPISGADLHRTSWPVLLILWVICIVV